MNEVDLNAGKCVAKGISNKMLTIVMKLAANNLVSFCQVQKSSADLSFERSHVQVGFVTCTLIVTEERKRLFG